MLKTLSGVNAPINAFPALGSSRPNPGELDNLYKLGSDSLPTSQNILSKIPQMGLLEFMKF